MFYPPPFEGKAIRLPTCVIEITSSFSEAYDHQQRGCVSLGTMVGVAIRNTFV